MWTLPPTWPRCEEFSAKPDTTCASTTRRASRSSGCQPNRGPYHGAGNVDDSPPAGTKKNTSYSVEFVRSGRSVTCGADEFVLDAALAAGPQAALILYPGHVRILQDDPVVRRSGHGAQRWHTSSGGCREQDSRLLFEAPQRLAHRQLIRRRDQHPVGGRPTFTLRLVSFSHGEQPRWARQFRPFRGSRDLDPSGVGTPWRRRRD